MVAYLRKRASHATATTAARTATARKILPNMKSSHARAATSPYSRANMFFTVAG